MPRTIWEWLEIEETRDKAVIKKAYARQAKKYHPEDSPREAQQLREAYKKALALAGGNPHSTHSEMFFLQFQQEIPARKKEEPRTEQPEGEPEETEGGYRYRGGDDRTQKEQPEGGPEREEGDCQYRIGADRPRKEQPQGGPEREEEGYRYRIGDGRSRRERLQGGPEREAGDYQYRIGADRQQKEQPQGGPEREEEGYRYQIGADRQQREQHQDRPGEAERDYRYHIPSEESREERLRQLEERLQELYRGGHQRPEQWSFAVKEYLTPEDLKDVYVIAAVLSILTQMPNLYISAWDVFEKELFSYCGEGAEWIWLKAQFAKMRKGDSIFSEKRRNDPAVRKLCLKEGEAYVEQSPSVHNHYIVAFAVFMIAMIWYFVLFYFTQ